MIAPRQRRTGGNNHMRKASTSKINDPKIYAVYYTKNDTIYYNVNFDQKKNAKIIVKK